MQKQELKHDLIKRLKKANAFWSYDQKSIKDVPDDILVELVMLHLDLDDIETLNGPELFIKVHRLGLDPDDFKNALPYLEKWREALEFFETKKKKDPNSISEEEGV